MTQEIKVKEPVVSDRYLKWLLKRKATLEREYNDAQEIGIKKHKGTRLKQIKDCLHYINTH